MAYLPAVWVVIGAGVALIGLRPRWSVAVWAAWAFCLVLAFFGTLLDLPALVDDLSPFQHIPLVPSEDLDVVPLVVLLGVAAALLAAGAAGLRRRDLPA
jgi:ABC-2 type transport system permease protein